MTKFQGQEEVEGSFVTTRGKVASFANSAAPGGQNRVDEGNLKRISKHNGG